MVRAARSGGPEGQNNGFLVDVDPPQVLGTWPVVVEAAGEREHRVHADLLFTTPCQAPLDAGDLLEALGVAERVKRKGAGRPSEILRFTPRVKGPLNDEGS